MRVSFSDAWTVKLEIERSQPQNAQRGKTSDWRISFVGIIQVQTNRIISARSVREDKDCKYDCWNHFWYVSCFPNETLVSRNVIFCSISKVTPWTINFFEVRTFINSFMPPKFEPNIDGLWIRSLQIPRNSGIWTSCNNNLMTSRPIGRTNWKCFRIRVDVKSISLEHKVFKCGALWSWYKTWIKLNKWRKIDLYQPQVSEKCQLKRFLVFVKPCPMFNT